MNDSVGYLSRVIYTCEEGYEMIGRAQLACDIDERWNGPPPRCEAIHCEPAVAIDNGIFTSINNVSVYGTIIQYECNYGFKLVGSQQLACMANGQYDNVPPACVGMFFLLSSIWERLKVLFLEISKHINVTTTTTSTTTPRTKSRPSRPQIPTTIRAINEKPSKPTYKTTEPPQIVVAGHPQDNEIAGSSVNVQHTNTPNVNVPLSIDGERKEPFGARLNLGAIIALAAFGGFIFLAAIITTIIILVRR